MGYAEFISTFCYNPIKPFKMIKIDLCSLTEHNDCCVWGSIIKCIRYTKVANLNMVQLRLFCPHYTPPSLICFTAFISSLHHCLNLCFLPSTLLSYCVGLTSNQIMNALRLETLSCINALHTWTHLHRHTHTQKQKQQADSSPVTYKNHLIRN